MLRKKIVLAIFAASILNGGAPVRIYAGENQPWGECCSEWFKGRDITITVGPYSFYNKFKDSPFMSTTGVAVMACAGIALYRYSNWYKENIKLWSGVFLNSSLDQNRQKDPTHQGNAKTAAKALGIRYDDIIKNPGSEDPIEVATKTVDEVLNQYTWTTYIKKLIVG